MDAAKLRLISFSSLSGDIRPVKSGMTKPTMTDAHGRSIRNHADAFAGPPARVVRRSCSPSPTLHPAQASDLDCSIGLARSSEADRRSSTATTTIPWALREKGSARPRRSSTSAKPQPSIMTDIARLQGRRRRRPVLVGLRAGRAARGRRPSPPRSSRSTSSTRWCAGTRRRSSWR